MIFNDKGSDWAAVSGRPNNLKFDLGRFYKLVKCFSTSLGPSQCSRRDSVIVTYTKTFVQNKLWTDWTPCTPSKRPSSSVSTTGSWGRAALSRLTRVPLQLARTSRRLRLRPTVSHFATLAPVTWLPGARF